MNYVLIVGIFQAMLCLFFLASGKKRQSADGLLFWLSVCILSHLSIKFIIYVIADNATIRAGFNTFIDLCYGPLLWLYAKKVQRPAFQPARYWFLFLPAFGAAVFYLALLILLLTNEQIALPILHGYNSITLDLIIASSLIYSAFGLRIAVKLPESVMASRRLLNRLSFLFIVFASNGIVALLVLKYLNGWSGIHTDLPFRIIAYASLSIVCVLVSVNLFHSQYVSAAVNAEAIPVGNDLKEAESGKVIAGERRSVLSSDKQADIIARVSLLMEQKKLYKDADLTLDRLAALADIPRHYLSEALNQCLDKTFYQFLNDYRIAYIKDVFDRCKDQQVSPNILSMAFEAGFNSKSTFNQYFKKATGYTPSEYLKQQPSPNTYPSIGNNLVISPSN